MKHWARRTYLTVLGICGLGLITGCDSSGVFDIVWGSLQLALGIVDVAT